MIRPSDLERAGSLLSQAGRLAVVSHERPDGDAAGSLLGMTLALRRRGQQATPVLAAELPARFEFLPGADGVATTIPDPVDLIVAVDCADLERTGLPAESLRRAPVLNIDHHPTNLGYGQANLVDPDAASTSQVLTVHSTALGLPLDREIALNYLAGLVTDTIGFRTPNVTPEVLRLAGDLEAQAGALAAVYQRLLNRHSFSSARYWGAGLSRLERSGALVWSRLTLEDRMASGYAASDDADLINLMTTIEGAEVFLLFVEQTGGKVKVSWRSNNGLDVSWLAQQFGGGGHAPAAGASVAGTMDEVVALVVERTLRRMESETEG